MTTRSVSKICSVERCVEQVAVKLRGLCSQHYHRWKRNKPLNTPSKYGFGSTYERRFWSRVALTADDNRCWEWQGGRNKKRGDYGQVQYQGKQRRAHVVAYALAHGGELPKLHVLHSCDNPPCVNPKHLREGTPVDNTADKVSRNRHSFGERVPNARINAETVRHIRESAEKGERSCDIARRLNLRQNLVYAVKHRITWRWVE